MESNKNLDTRQFFAWLHSVRCRQKKLLFLKARDISVPEKALKLLVKTRDYEYIKFRFVIV